jgi:hypothetical protein
VVVVGGGVVEGGEGKREEEEEWGTTQKTPPPNTQHPTPQTHPELERADEGEVHVDGRELVRLEPVAVPLQLAQDVCDHEPPLLVVLEEALGLLVDGRLPTVYVVRLEARVGKDVAHVLLHLLREPPLARHAVADLHAPPADVEAEAGRPRDVLKVTGEVRPLRPAVPQEPARRHLHRRLEVPEVLGRVEAREPLGRVEVEPPVLVVVANGDGEAGRQAPAAGADIGPGEVRAALDGLLGKVARPVVDVEVEARVAEGGDVNVSVAVIVGVEDRHPVRLHVRRHGEEARVGRRVSEGAVPVVEVERVRPLEPRHVEVVPAVAVHVPRPGSPRQDLWHAKGARVPRLARRIVLVKGAVGRRLDGLLGAGTPHPGLDGGVGEADTGWGRRRGEGGGGGCEEASAGRGREAAGRRRCRRYAVISKDG